MPEQPIPFQYTRRMFASLFRSKSLRVAFATIIFCVAASTLQAQTGGNIVMPKINFGVETAKNSKDVSVSLQIMLLMTVLTVAPSLLILTTAFTRLIIVFSLLRSALGTPQLPPNQVLAGLSLFLTVFIMQPVFTQIQKEALTPYFDNKITLPVAMEKAEKPLRTFMLHQTYKSDLNFFITLSKAPAPATENDVSMITVIPAFITSELKTAFIIGFYIYLPFLVIDMVVASTLMSMGMMMLPPSVVSLPAKLLLFVLANGWTLLIESLAKGFR